MTHSPDDPLETALGDIRFVRASTVKPTNVRWAWRGWIPLGMLSLLLGLPGRGKTTLAEQLAADVTCGRLEGYLFGQPAHVLMISYEDAIAETLVPRLIAAEADLDRVEFVACRDVGQVLDITRHLPDIERRAAECKARLLVIDPLVAGLPRQEVNSYRDQDVRSVLAPLAALAGTARFSCTEHHAFLKERSECTLRCWRQHRLCRCRALNPGLRSRSAGRTGRCRAQAHPRTCEVQCWTLTKIT